MIAKLILKANDDGYLLTFGEAFRSDEQATINAMGDSDRREVAALIRQKPKFILLSEAIANNPKTANGIVLSLHTIRLAVDFNIFNKAGILCSAAEITPLGEYWESIGGTWGGRFQDPSHFSLEHNGRK
jgi:hypothetical protein